MQCNAILRRAVTKPQIENARVAHYHCTGDYTCFLAGTIAKMAESDETVAQIRYVVLPFTTSRPALYHPYTRNHSFLSLIAKASSGANTLFCSIEDQDDLASQFAVSQQNQEKGSRECLHSRIVQTDNMASFVPNYLALSRLAFQTHIREELSSAWSRTMASRIGS